MRLRANIYAKLLKGAWFAMLREFWIGLKAILRSARRLINARLIPLNLTSAEGDVLFHLIIEKSELTQESLAERLDIGKAAISRTVNSLVKKGYAQRQKNPADARAYHIILTKKANGISAEVLNIYNSVYELIKANISEDEFRLLSAVLKRINENLAMEAGICC